MEGPSGGTPQPAQSLKRKPPEAVALSQDPQTSQWPKWGWPQTLGLSPCPQRPREPLPFHVVCPCRLCDRPSRVRPHDCDGRLPPGKGPVPGSVSPSELSLIKVNRPGDRRQGCSPPAASLLTVSGRHGLALCRAPPPTSPSPSCRVREEGRGRKREGVPSKVQRLGLREGRQRPGSRAGPERGGWGGGRERMSHGVGAGGGLEGRPGGSGPAGLLGFSHTRALTGQCATSHVSPAGCNRLDQKGLAMSPEVAQGCSLSPGPGGILSELENFSPPCPEQSGPGLLQANPTAHVEASNYQQRRSTPRPYRGHGKGDRRSPEAQAWGTWRAAGAGGPLGTHLPPSRYGQAAGTRRPSGGRSLQLPTPPTSPPGKPPEPQDISAPLGAQRTLRKPKVTHTFQLSLCHPLRLPPPQVSAGGGMGQQAGELRGGRGGKRENT